jgi:Mg2+-importing ATPase
MVASSNFGNILSILAASTWLRFEPMTALQMLVQNLLYDMSQIAIPWDRMDAEYVAVPQRWDIKDLFRFIVILGPTSSTVGISTFLLNWFYYGIQSADDDLSVMTFRTHWFLGGLLSQTLVVHLLRTAKIPVFQSCATKELVISTVAIMCVGITIPYIAPITDVLGLVRPQTSFLGFLAAEWTLYCLEVQMVKVLYKRVFGTWL